MYRAEAVPFGLVFPVGLMGLYIAGGFLCGVKIKVSLDVCMLN